MDVKNCMYTLTDNEDFIICRHPRCKDVVMALGFSGHGYKFAPAIGDILASSDGFLDNAILRNFSL